MRRAGDVLTATMTFVVALALYVLTLAPGLTGGDAGELVVVAAARGVAHAPGYPLYTTLASLVAALPLGSLAARVSLVSALAGAAAVGLLTRLLHDVTGRRDVALVGAALFATSPLVWTYATSAEVFALHHVFIVALLLAARSLLLELDRPRALAFGLVSGLGLSHHHTILFVVGPALITLLVVHGRALLRPRAVGALALGLVVGLAPYLYLPLAARDADVLSMGDPSTWAGFVDHVLRRDYGTLRLVGEGDAAGGGYLERLLLWSRSFVALAGVLSPLLFVGAVRAARSRDPLLLTVVGALALYLVIFLALANIDVSQPLLRGVLARFFGHAHLLGVVLVGAGLTSAASRLSRRSRRAAFVVVGVGVAVAVAVAVGARLPEARARQAGHIEAYGRLLLEDLPPGAVLLTRGDLPTNAARYLQVAEGLRDDVVVLDQELLTRPWYVARARRLERAPVLPGERYGVSGTGAFDVAALLAANPDRPTFVYPDVKPGDTRWSSTWTLVPAGLPQRLTPLPALPAFPVERREVLSSVRTTTWPDVERFGPETWERVVRDDLLEALHREGVFRLQRAIALGSRRAWLEAARDALEEAKARARPAVPWYLEKNLGLTYAHLARHEPDDATRALAAWRAYLDTAPADEPDRAAIERAAAELAARVLTDDGGGRRAP